MPVPRLRSIAVGIAVVILAAAGSVPRPSIETSPSHPTSPPSGPAGGGFEPNVGQAQPSVRFMARAPGGAIALTQRGAVTAVTAPSVKRWPPRPSGRTGQAKSSLRRDSLRPGDVAVRVLRMDFAGGRSVSPIAWGLLSGRTNEMLGSDPRSWKTGVPRYRSVRYPEAFPGVDVRFDDNAGGPEYTFDVAANADPGRIALRFSGQRSLRLDPRGDLVLEVGGARVVESRPFAYQTVDRVRRPVAAAFDLRSGGLVGFRLGSYDRRLPLVIDPSIVYSSFLGGAGSDVAIGVAIDGDGAAYVTGYTMSANFPTTPGAYRRTFGGVADAYVTKVSPNGHSLVYSTYLGGSSEDVGESVAVNRKGAVVVAGYTRSANFPTTSGAVQRSFGGVYDAFLAKLGPTGGALKYSTYLGGSSDDEGFAVTLDATGADAFVTGSTGSSNFPTTVGVYQRQRRGRLDAFVAKVHPVDGLPLAYSTYLGATGDDLASGIALGDVEGRVYVTGLTSSTAYPTTSGAFQRVYGGGHFDAFVTKLNPPASGLNYSTYVGSSGDDQGVGIQVDGTGDAFVSGSTTSSRFPVTGAAFQRNYHGASDAFVTKVDPNPGQPLVYSTYLGGTKFDAAYLLGIDSAGHADVAGITGSSDFPVVDAFQGTFGGGTYDAFLTKVSVDGSALQASTFIGGGAHDVASGVAVGGGAVVVVGDTDSPAFPIRGDPFQPRLGGGYDGFVAKFDPG